MNRIVTYIRQSLKDIYPPEEVRAMIQIICCDMLSVRAIDLYTDKDINLSVSKELELKNIVIRLQKNEPIQYVRGVADFCGMTFKVCPGVLIPRPETAELVYLIIKEQTTARRLLDIGTGSGCIAVSLAKQMKGTSVTAWDISSRALEVARQNNVMCGTDVCFEKQDVFAKIENDDSLKYDVIVSNPPYVRNSEKQEMNLNVLDWEPESALFVSDDDPLLFYRRIAILGLTLLKPDGFLYFEINRAFGQEVVSLLKKHHYQQVRLLKDFYGNDRIVSAKR